MAIVFSPIVLAPKPIAIALLPCEVPAESLTVAPVPIAIALLPFEPPPGPLTTAPVPIAIALSAHGPTLLPEPIATPAIAPLTAFLPIEIA